MLPSATAIMPTVGDAGAPVCGVNRATPFTRKSAAGSTFKSPLTATFPNLEYFLISLYETLKDIELFIIDLI